MKTCIYVDFQKISCMKVGGGEFTIKTEVSNYNDALGTPIVILIQNTSELMPLAMNEMYSCSENYQVPCKAFQLRFNGSQNMSYYLKFPSYILPSIFESLLSCQGMSYATCHGHTMQIIFLQHINFQVTYRHIYYLSCICDV